MIKTILLSTFLVAFAVIAVPMSSANACTTCGCADKASHGHSHAKKPCEKTMGKKKPCTKCDEAQAHYDKKDAMKKPCMKCEKAGKPCKCAKMDKKPCEKTMGKKAPCTKCNEAQAHYDRKDAMKKMPANNKGSLVIQSGQSFKSRASAGYN